MIINNNKINKGQSLFELVIAVGVVAVIIVGLVSIVNNALQNSAYSRNETLSARLAEDGTEWIRSQRDKDISTFLTRANGTWCLNDSPLTDTSWTTHSACAANSVISGTPFKRQVVFTSIGSTKTVILAAITVSWTDSKGTHQVNSSTHLTDWRER